MKQQERVGLLAEGKLRDFSLLRLASVQSQLGPVKSSSLRVASRMVNQLRAGRAVREFRDLDRCRLVLVCVPGAHAADCAKAMARSAIVWTGKCVLFCNYWGSEEIGAALAAKGAEVGFLTELPASNMYLMEGAPVITKLIRPLLRRALVHSISIEPGARAFVFAGLSCAGPICYSLLVAAGDCLREAGLAGVTASRMLQRTFGQTLRTYLKAGRNALPEAKRLQLTVPGQKAGRQRLVHFVEGISALSARYVAKL